MNKWRRHMTNTGTFNLVTQLTNNGGWVFDDVHRQYKISLVNYESESSSTETVIKGEFFDSISFRSVDRAEGLTLEKSEFEYAGPGLMFPSPLRPDTGLLFRKYLQHKRIGDRSRMDFAVESLVDATAGEANTLESQSGNLPKEITVVQGKSFDVWEPNLSVDTPTVASSLFELFLASKSKEAQLYKKTRIVYRQITRSDDARTLRISIVPPNCLIKETAFYLNISPNDASTQMFILGFLSTRISDWFVRCLVDRRILPSLFSYLRIPEVTSDNPLRNRIEALTQAIVSSRHNHLENWGKVSTLTPRGLTDMQLLDSIDEIEASAALLVGLTANDIQMLFETFHVGWDYEDKLVSTLQHFRRLESKV